MDQSAPEILHKKFKTPSEIDFKNSVMTLTKSSSIGKWKCEFKNFYHKERVNNFIIRVENIYSVHF